MTRQRNENDRKGVQMYLSHPWESIKTFYLMLTWITLGIQLELVGPTLTILAKNTQVNYSKISRILMARSAGYLTGNMIGAFAQKLVKKYPELILSLAFFLAGIIVYFTPIINSLIILSVGFFLQGISQGTTDLGGMSLMLTMWKDDASAPLNLVHLGFGIGAVIGNFLVKYYLQPDRSIRMAYGISAFLCFLIGLGHLGIFIWEIFRQKRSKNTVEEKEYSAVSRREVENNVNDKEMYSSYSPRSCGYGSFYYGLFMSIFWIIYMFFLNGNDQTFGKFFFSYLKSEKFSMSDNEATWGMIIYWSSYSLGRLICAIFTTFFSVQVILTALWSCGFILASTWGIFVWAIELEKRTLFILGGFTGLVFSPTFPLSFAYLNERLNVNPFLLGFIFCGGSIGAILFQQLGGILLDKNANLFPALLIICVILSIIFYLCASILSQKFFKKRDEQTNLSRQNRSEEEEQMEEYLSKSKSDFDQEEK